MTGPVKTPLAKPEKPLGGKAYGSIGHLPSSRVGPGDWHVHEGQARICLEKPRKGDRVIVTEKVDGACMAVAKIGGAIVALTRAGYRATDGAWPHLRAFEPYVDEHRAQFDRLLADGERVCGEWMALAHGTRYDPARGVFAPFFAFDIIRDGKRVLREEFAARVTDAEIAETAVMYAGPDGFSVEQALSALGAHGYHGAIDPVEGAVWRVEREGRVDFLAKYVVPGKVDGSYLPNISGLDPVWNWPSLAPREFDAGVMTASPAVTLRAAVFHDLVGDTAHPVFVADAVNAIFHARSDAAAEASALDRFRDLNATNREKLFAGVVHALRVTARGGATERSG